MARAAALALVPGAIEAHGWTHEAEIVAAHAKLALALLVILVVTALLIVWPRPTAVRTLFRITHLLPVLLQCTIFAYWFLHCPTGRALAPTMLASCLLAFPIDAESSAARAPKLRAVARRAGHEPFAQFFLTNVAGGIARRDDGARREVGDRRGDRQVFNPSAVGLLAIGVRLKTCAQVGDISTVPRG